MLFERMLSSAVGLKTIFCFLWQGVGPLHCRPLALCPSKCLDQPSLWPRYEVDCPTAGRSACAKVAARYATKRTRHCRVTPPREDCFYHPPFPSQSRQVLPTHLSQASHMALAASSSEARTKLFSLCNPNLSI